MILGNLDRIAQVRSDFRGLLTMNDRVAAESNIGNIMIKKPTNEIELPVLYAIDNNIHIETEDLEQYKEFISLFSKNALRGNLLARNITDFIEQSFKSTSSPFYQDLQLPEDAFDDDSYDDEDIDITPSASSTEIPAAKDFTPEELLIKAQQQDIKNILTFLSDLSSYRKALIAGAT